MKPAQQVGAGLAVAGVLLLANGYYLDLLFTIDQSGQIRRWPLYFAAATVGGLAAVGCSVRLLRESEPPTVRDGLVVTIVVLAAQPLVSALFDPGFHAVLVDDPIESIRGLGTTIRTTPRAVLSGTPGPTLGAVLAPTVLIGIAAGRREWRIAGSSIGIVLGIGLVTAGTAQSAWAPLAYVLLLAEPVAVFDAVPVPGVGWMLALSAPIAGFVAVDAIRAIRDADDEESDGDS